jgi:hypothetical protein
LNAVDVAQQVHEMILRTGGALKAEH